METNHRYKNTLEHLKRSSNYRTLSEEQVEYNVDLSSNDYLGLLNDKSINKSFYENLNSKKHLLGSGSSRLLSGNSKEYVELETLITKSYQREACLLFNSGYHANTGILPALAGKQDLIIADKLIHASIIDGMQLSKAKSMRFSHLNYEHLEKILLESRADYENVFIVTESIFSMDGDIADLERLVNLKQQYNCYLYVDEAHSVGVRGKTGLGCVEELNIIQKVDFIIGTFGKALASIGAFVICDDVFKKYMVNHSRTLIYTTALPPINLAWTKYVFENLPALKVKREQLKKLSSEFINLLNTGTQSHIVPYIIGDNKDAISVSNILKENGINVLPIRYPTVPKNTARLRFSLNSDLDIDKLKTIKNILDTHEQTLVK